jgi:hypothetical protein
MRRLGPTPLSHGGKDFTKVPDLLLAEMIEESTAHSGNVIRSGLF